MQTVSELYRTIHAGLHYTEVRALINGVVYGEDQLVKLRTSTSLLGDTLEVGMCYAGEIDVELLEPSVDIPKMATIIPQCRIVNSQNTSQKSEWLPKGTYWIDTRETSQSGDNQLIIHGYDAMLKAEQEFPSMSGSWPKTASAVVAAIATAMGVTQDSRNSALMTPSYNVQLPSNYTCREVLGYIGAMYAGCWIMSDDGQLRLVTLDSLPKETNLLLATADDYLAFADGTRILISPN